MAYNRPFLFGMDFARLSSLMMSFRSKSENEIRAASAPGNEPRSVGGAQSVPSGAPRSASRQASIWVEVVRDPKVLAQHIHAWEDLVVNAIEPNVFYEPWMVMPALRTLGVDCDLQFILVFASNPTHRTGSPILCGIFPLERSRRYKRLPIKVLSLWKHLFCYLCTPLIRRGYARQTMAAFFEWLESDAETAALMEFCYVSGDSAFSQLLTDHLNEHGALSTVAESFTRALLKPGRDADEYVRTAISGRHMKELRRKKSRLSETGKLRFDVLQLDEDPGHWIDEFLQLEASGWKGKEGTAFACDESARAFFVATAKEAFLRGRLMMLAVSLDGHPIAMKCNLLAGQGAFAFKIAYDESYARFSPGLLLEIENIKLLHKASGIEWMDSCAVSTHTMINRLWLDRKKIETVLVATGKSFGGFLVSIMPLMRWGKRMMFGTGKTIKQTDEAPGEGV